MSFVCKGVTHCKICGKILKIDEIGMCEDNRNILFEEIMESIKEQRKSLDRIEEIIRNL